MRPIIIRSLATTGALAGLLITTGGVAAAQPEPTYPDATPLSQQDDGSIAGGTVPGVGPSVAAVPGVVNEIVNSPDALRTLRMLRDSF
jgi:hypothetical protein